MTAKTTKMLWGRAANRCAICRMELVMDATETDDLSVVGEACHIVAQSENGPRGSSEMTREQRDLYGNLLLLCNVYHKVIDDQPGEYTVERLREIKTTHEAWVRSNLGMDAPRQRDDEAYASIIDEWVDRAGVGNWNADISGMMMADQPRIHNEVLDRLEAVRPWLLARVWPGRYLELESAFDNFRFVCQDLISVFREHAEDFGDSEKQTRKFYQSRDWDEERYRRLGRQYDWHVDLVFDLTAELTRAVNYVSDMIRRHVLPNFRLADGVSLITTGPNSRMQFVQMRLEYRGAERAERPYPGLEAFLDLRTTRDYAAGAGQPPA